MLGIRFRMTAKCVHLLRPLHEDNMNPIQNLLPLFKMWQRKQSIPDGHDQWLVVELTAYEQTNADCQAAIHSMKGKIPSGGDVVSSYIKACEGVGELYVQQWSWHKPSPLLECLDDSLANTFNAANQGIVEKIVFGFQAAVFFNANNKTLYRNKPSPPLCAHDAVREIIGSLKISHWW